MQPPKPQILTILDKIIVYLKEHKPNKLVTSVGLSSQRIGPFLYQLGHIDSWSGKKNTQGMIFKELNWEP